MINKWYGKDDHLFAMVKAKTGKTNVIQKACLRMCGNTRQPRYSLVPSASLNSAAGVAADTLILQSASFASWPCDRCARVPWAGIKWAPARFPTDRCGQRAVVPFFPPFFSRRHTADTDKECEREEGSRGRYRKRTAEDKNSVFLSLYMCTYRRARRKRAATSLVHWKERVFLPSKDYTYIYLRWN